ncbi:MAG: glycosyltransferase family 39 protein, partial [Anaerolineae bacterium]|nr:glycosyltransferase family 39 protein [Anaerolineae bacterium]
MTFYGDAAVASRNSSFFDGVAWTRDDLSGQTGDQQGEFYVRLAYTKNLFADQSLTTERIIILLFLLNALSLLVIFYKEVNSFRVFDAFTSMVMSIIRSRKTIILLLAIFLLGLGLRVYFVTHYPHPEVIKDAALYDTQARNIVSGYGASSDPPQIYSFLFGYPLFLASLYFVFGYSLQVVYLAQAVLGSLLSLVVFGITYESFGKNKYISSTAALLVALYPPFIEYTDRLLTETVATLTLGLFVYLFILALRSATARFVFLSGMAFGLTAISRDLFFYLIIFIPIAIFITFWPQGKTILRSLSLFLVGFVLVYSIAVTRDVHLFQYFNFKRLVRLPLAGTLVVITDANQVARSDSLVQLMKDEPENWNEISSKNTEEALQESLNNIIRGLLTTPFDYLSTYAKKWGPRLEVFWYYGLWSGSPILGIPLDRLLIFHRLIVFLAFPGVVVSLCWWKKHLFLYWLIVYPSLVHAIVLAIPRYIIPWMPYICIFAAVGIATMVGMARQARSGLLILALTA